jgi:hypothetical protein
VRWIAVGHEWSKVWGKVTFAEFCRVHGLNNANAATALRRLGYKLSVGHKGSWRPAKK